MIEIALWLSGSKRLKVGAILLETGSDLIKLLLMQFHVFGSSSLEAKGKQRCLLAIKNLINRLIDELDEE